MGNYSCLLKWILGVRYYLNSITAVIIASVVAWDRVLANWIAMLISWLFDYWISDIVVERVVTMLLLRIVKRHAWVSWRSVEELATCVFRNLLDNLILLHCLLRILNDAITRDVCWWYGIFTERRMASDVEVAVRRRERCLIRLKW